MPCDLTAENYKQILESKFIWIGLVENLRTSVDILAGHLGFEQVPVNYINVSERDEVLSPDTREEFIRNNRLEFKIYRYVKEYMG